MGRVWRWARYIAVNCDNCCYVGSTPSSRSFPRYNAALTPNPNEEGNLKKYQLVLTLALLVSVPMQAFAYSGLDCRDRNDVTNVLTDVVVIRPAGFVATLVGGALFIGLSPLTALASIPEPHDSFKRVGGILVGIPYDYTFVRPLGYFSNTCS